MSAETAGGTTSGGVLSGSDGARSIVGAFTQTVERRQSAIAAHFRGDDGQWASMTWVELDTERRALATGLAELGMKPGERAVILSNTSMKWMIADLATQSAGGTVVPIYQSNLAHEAEYIINDSESVYVFAEDAEQRDKLLEQKTKLERVRRVVVMNDDDGDDPWTMKWSDLRAQGEAKLDEHSSEIDERVEGLGAEDILTIIYTSGTTGKPKGVVLTHANMLYEAKAAMEIDVITHDDLEYFFLPMAHVFAKVLQCIWLYSGHGMAIDHDTTRITENLGHVKPTVMASVPRIFEKVYAKVVAGGLESPGLKGKLFKWTVGLNDQYAQLMVEDKPIPFGLQMQLGLAKKLVFAKINERLNTLFGGRLRFFISGGAPLPKKMAYFFDNAGIVILEGYGLTETSAASCLNRPTMNRIGTVGPPFPGTEVKIAPDGEILIKGPGVMREYYNRPDATAEVKLADGWFATGDIGVITAEGCVKITDRKKDIIVTAGGKNVAPQNIENLIKSSNPLISQVMVHGDKRKYLVALVTLDPDNAASFGKEHGISGGYAAVCRSDAAKAAVQATLDECNAQLARFETVKYFAILEKDFEVGEEMTPTLKVKRKYVNELHKDLLNSFYDEAVE